MRERDTEPVHGDGHTDYDDDDVVFTLVRSGLARSAAIVPASLRRLPADTQGLVMAVARQAEVVAHDNRVLEQLVTDARDAGASWSALGWVLGMTGEGARRRWGVRDE